jgi:hypothetical protein
MEMITGSDWLIPGPVRIPCKSLESFISLSAEPSVVPHFILAEWPLDRPSYPQRQESGEESSTLKSIRVIASMPKPPAIWEFPG